MKMREFSVEKEKLEERKAKGNSAKKLNDERREEKSETNLYTIRIVFLACSQTAKKKYFLLFFPNEKHGGVKQKKTNV